MMLRYVVMNTYQLHDKLLGIKVDILCYGYILPIDNKSLVSKYHFMAQI